MQTLKKGFTLIELLIVIVIIGILAGIVVGIVGTSANQKAQDAKLKANVHEVQNALEQYYIDNGSYPAGTDASATGLGALVSATPKYLNSADTYTNLLYQHPVAGGYELSFALNNKNEKTDSTNVKDVSGVRTYYVTSKQQ